MIAIEKEHIEIVRELIERGADINANSGKRRRYKEGQHWYGQVIMDI